MYQAEILDKSDEEGSTSSVGSNNPDYDPTDQPKQNYRSAQKYRSAHPHQSWILVSKEPKRFKHQNTTAVHWGDTVTLKTPTLESNGASSPTNVLNNALPTALPPSKPWNFSLAHAPERRSVLEERGNRYP
jgi:hypothetical protein